MEGYGRSWELGAPDGSHHICIYLSNNDQSQHKVEVHHSPVLLPATRSRRQLPSYDYQVSLARLEPVTRAKPD